MKGFLHEAKTEQLRVEIGEWVLTFIDIFRRFTLNEFSIIRQKKLLEMLKSILK